MRSIVLYGLKSAKEAYQCVRYDILGCERMSIMELKFAASDFAQQEGAIDEVWATNDHYSLRDHYRASIKEGHLESDSVDFKLYLEKTGVRVY